MSGHRCRSEPRAGFPRPAAFLSQCDAPGEPWPSRREREYASLLRELHVVVGRDDVVGAVADDVQPFLRHAPTHLAGDRAGLGRRLHRGGEDGEGGNRIQRHERGPSAPGHLGRDPDQGALPVVGDETQPAGPTSAWLPASGFRLPASGFRLPVSGFNTVQIF